MLSETSLSACTGSLVHILFSWESQDFEFGKKGAHMQRFTVAI